MEYQKSSVTQWGRDNDRGRYVVYAASVYRVAACRGDMKGIVPDRRAMRSVSKALGHNRLGVVTHYLNNP